MKKNNNDTVMDINKVQYAKLFFMNQFGNVRMKMPEHPSSRGNEFDPDEMCYNSGLTMMEYAIKYKQLDKWQPIAEFQFASNHYLTYTDDKALSVWQAWRAKIFGKKG